MTDNGSVKNGSVKRLLSLWAERYVPDTLSLGGDLLTASQQLTEAALPAGRAATVAKAQYYLQLYCDRTGIATNALFSYIPNVVQLSEVQHLSQFVRQVYSKTLEIYQQQLPPSSAPGVTPVPAVEQLARELAPVLLELSEQYKLIQEQRPLGFITTSFHFSSKLVLSQLTKPEQVLLSPYFKFVEEQVSIPWQRVCTTAARHHPDLPTITLVQQMLPLSQDIAETVYRRATELYPTHRSRRGGLGELGVMHSMIRDLIMFQVYLWLCVLEGSMAAMEQELLPLCVMVFPNLQVTWELVREILLLLADELLRYAPPESMQLLLPYIQAMQQLFARNPQA